MDNSIIRSWNGRVIRQRAGSYLCLTDMANASNKRTDNWIRLKETTSLLREFMQDEDYQGLQALIQEEGRNGGTFGHPDIAIQFAQWCSSKFALQVSKWVRELITNGYVRLEDVDNTPKYLPPLEQADKALSLVERYKENFGAINPQMEQHFKDLVGNCLLDFMALTHKANQKELWMGVVNYAETELGYKVSKKGTHCDTTLGKWVRWYCPHLSDKQERRFCNETQREIFVYPIHLVGAQLNKSISDFFAHPNPSSKLKSDGAYKRKK